MWLFHLPSSIIIDNDLCNVVTLFIITGCASSVVNNFILCVGIEYSSDWSYQRAEAENCKGENEWTKIVLKPGDHWPLWSSQLTIIPINYNNLYAEFTVCNKISSLLLCYLQYKSGRTFKWLITNYWIAVTNFWDRIYNITVI